MRDLSERPAQVVKAIRAAMAQYFLRMATITFPEAAVVVQRGLAQTASI
jgi:hypothetical protein